MKKILGFSFNNDNFELVDIESKELIYKITLEELKLDSKKIYDKLFKNLDSTPTIDVIDNYEAQSDNTINRKAKMIYLAIKDIIDEICKTIDDKKIFEDDVEVLDN